MPWKRPLPLCITHRLRKKNTKFSSTCQQYYHRSEQVSGELRLAPHARSLDWHAFLLLLLYYYYQYYSEACSETDRRRGRASDLLCNSGCKDYNSSHQQGRIAGSGEAAQCCKNEEAVKGKQRDTVSSQPVVRAAEQTRGAEGLRRACLKRTPTAPIRVALSAPCSPGTYTTSAAACISMPQCRVAYVTCRCIPESVSTGMTQTAGRHAEVSMGVRALPYLQTVFATIGSQLSCQAMTRKYTAVLDWLLACK